MAGWWLLARAGRNPASAATVRGSRVLRADTSLRYCLRSAGAVATAMRPWRADGARDRRRCRYSVVIFITGARRGFSPVSIATAAVNPTPSRCCTRSTTSPPFAQPRQFHSLFRNADAEAINAAAHRTGTDQFASNALERHATTIKLGFERWPIWPADNRMDTAGCGVVLGKLFMDCLISHQIKVRRPGVASRPSSFAAQLRTESRRPCRRRGP